MTEAFYKIETAPDIAYFLDRTNGLHDAYLIGVQYTHNGHTGTNPHFIDPALSELRLRYMVTSIRNAVVELVFSAIAEWQIKDHSFDITDTAVSFTDDGQIIWADDSSTEAEERVSGSYMIAGKMQWRFCEVQ